MKIKKRILVIVLAAILLVSTILIFPIDNKNGEGGPFGSLGLGHEIQAAERSFGAAATPIAGITSAEIPLSAAEIGEILDSHTPREGFILAPTMFGLTGVETTSQFLLRTPVSFEEELPQITLDGGFATSIIRKNENTFLITPTVNLLPNSVYIFRLIREGASDIIWAFQTTIRFEVESVFPRHQATNVPVETGIEIDFSFGDAPDISEFFNIYPRVEGQFIKRGATAIFAPTNPLDYGQIYTVTLAPGIYLPGTTQVITTPLQFSFETTIEAHVRQQNNQQQRSMMSFSNWYAEFPTFAAPSISFWLSVPREMARPAINLEVFYISCQEQAIRKISHFALSPHWSIAWRNLNYFNVSDFTRIYSTTITQANTNEFGWSETYTFRNNLPAGFYIVRSTVNDLTSYMFIQITDTAVQIVADDNRALVWINDMNTGRPAANAQVFDPISGQVFAAAEYGIAVVERDLRHRDYLIIQTGDKESVVFINSAAFQSFFGGWDSWHWGSDWYFDSHSSWMPSSQAGNNQYWAALQLDRTLFQRNDTLNLWGFVQNRRTDENISHVTAVLTENNWWRSSQGRDTLHTQNFSVNYGAYHGEIHLPHLDPGTYRLAIFHGDILLSSTFFTVMDYVTPPYQLTVEASHRAIFAGEEITLTARTEFFEGTPVPDLAISYSFWGQNLQPQTWGQEGRTNSEGVLEIIAIPTPSNASIQGESRLNFSAEATLPEIGRVFQEASARVFVNDIHLSPRASRSGQDANLFVDVRNITLERINNNTATHWGDFLDTPAAGQRINVEIFEIYWERVRDGEFYDHINRRVVPRYRHIRHERLLETFETTTNANGHAEANFQVPNREFASYQARLTTTDGNGRQMHHTVFIGRNFTSFHNAAQEGLFLYGANEEGYGVGDMVELVVMEGLEAAIGNILFVVVQNGILSYHIGQNPLNFTFSPEHAPNVRVFAFHFNGHTYHTNWAMSQRLQFNTAGRELNIEITTCQEAYRPGDLATFTLRVTDMQGNPRAANINMSLVDEALFALRDYSVDTLASLFSNISDSLRLSMATHHTFESSGLTRAETEVASPGAAGGSDMAMDSIATSYDAEDSQIRQQFEDTAIFASLRTNAQGIATFTAPLPDNITSWRITASAISEDLYAGNIVQNLRVTLPMFLHSVLGHIFLVGDAPYIGVNAYGTSLLGGEEVLFEVWRQEYPQDIRRAIGTAFARINIPLWEKTAEGFGEILVRATVAGYSDTILHSYQVLSSHRKVDMATFYEVAVGTSFAVNPGGLTNITFTDQGRGQFLHTLLSLRHTWRSGVRIEGLVARREAYALIAAHFPDIGLSNINNGFNILSYQVPSGGIAVLPHGDADLAATVLMLPFILNDINIPAMHRYLWGIAETSTTDSKMLALYGLALMGEPALLELQRYAALGNLSPRNAAYVALGLAALGELEAAHGLYQAHLAPHIQWIAPYYRINVGTNRANILEATSLAALLAAQLGLPEALGLHNYATRHQPHSLLMNIERLLFISHEIENHTNTRASITYTLFGETIVRNLAYGGQFTLRIPAQNIHEFSIIDITGEVGAVSIARVPLEDIETVESDIIIQREFFTPGSNTPTTTFNQGDLVRVQITITYPTNAFRGTYLITDFLPAGLVHVPNSARVDQSEHTHSRHIHAATDGQRITFFDTNTHLNNRVRTYHYYARVVSAGTFYAEGTLIQGLDARTYMAIGSDAIITIIP